MHAARFVMLWIGLLALAACSSSSDSVGKFRTYHGPPVTEVRVYKAERLMELWHNDQLLRTFTVELGGEPYGHKTTRGDRRTPEGLYYIDRRNSESRFHLSLGISYPNAADIAQATRRGVSPGGDIFIHGRGPWFQFAQGDWTEGCIAVSDYEIEEIYAMVRDRTPIVILPSRNHRLVRL